MKRRTVLIVPATVPGAQVMRVQRPEPQSPIPVCADPYPVPTAEARRVLPEQLTSEQVEQLRAENRMLREEIERVRSGHLTG